MKKILIYQIVKENEALLKEAKSTMELTAWAFTKFGRPFSKIEFDYFVAALKNVKIDYSNLEDGVNGVISLGSFSQLMKESNLMKAI